MTQTFFFLYVKPPDSNIPNKAQLEDGKNIFHPSFSHLVCGCTTFVLQISLSPVTAAPLNRTPTSWESVLHIRNDFQSQLGKWVTAAVPTKMLPLAVFSLDLSVLKGLDNNVDGSCILISIQKFQVLFSNNNFTKLDGVEEMQNSALYCFLTSLFSWNGKENWLIYDISKLRKKNVRKRKTFRNLWTGNFYLVRSLELRPFTDVMPIFWSWSCKLN